MMSQLPMPLIVTIISITITITGNGNPVETIGDNTKVALQLAHQIHDFPCIGQNLQRLTVGIIADSKGPFDRGGELAHLLLGLREGLGEKVHLLKGGDHGRLLARELRLKGQDVGGVRDGVREFRRRRQQSSAEHFQFVVLFAQAELDGEEVALLKVD